MNKGIALGFDYKVGSKVMMMFLGLFRVLLNYFVGEK